MRRRARVTSIDELQTFREALIRFAEEGRMGLAAISADMRRTVAWVEDEQWSYWQREVKRRTNALAQARIELQRQELAGKRAVDERRAVTRAKQRLEESHEKLKIVKRWRRMLSRDLDLHVGALRQLETTLLQNIPQAVATIDRAVANLERYLQVAPPVSEPARGEEGGPETAERTPQPAGDEIDLAALRARRPSEAERRAARLIKIDEPPAPEKGATVVLDPDVLSREAIFLDRSSPACENDSGWYIGGVEGPPTDRRFHAAPVEEVLRRRPELREALDSGEGCALLFRAGRVECILPPSDLAVDPGKERLQ